MKCKQNQCNRSKNILDNGYCKVCDDVIKDVHKSKEVIKKSNIKEVYVDLECMIRMHERLLKGEQVDQKDVSSLLLSGIIKILMQHDLINTLEVKAEEIEHENRTNKLRLESLEDWVMKQNESIKDLDNKIEVEAKKLKEQVNENVQNTSTSPSHELPKSVFKCKECGKTFSKNCQLEDHLEEHESLKKFKCETCNKEFFLNWRLQKHEEMHSRRVKACKYFKDKQNCPFEKIGCMFGHDDFDEETSSDNIEDITEESSTEDENSFAIGENQCHLCEKEFETKDDRFDHVQAEHQEYYNGMLEVVANANMSR